MKTIYVFFIFLLSDFTSFSQVTIKGKILNYDGQIIAINQPVDHFQNETDFRSENDTITISSSGDFTKELDIQEPSFITVRTGLQPIWLIVFPKDTFDLQIDFAKSKFKDSSIIKGSNEDGQALYNRFNFYPIDKFIPIQNYFKGKKFISNILLDSVNSIIDHICLPFDTLYQNGRISKQFYNFTLKNTRALLLGEAFKYLVRPNKLTLESNIDSLAMFRELFMKQVNLDDKDLYNGLLTIYTFVSYFECLYLNKNRLRHNEQIQDSIIIRGEKRWLVKAPFVSILYCNQFLKEKLWGTILYNLYNYFPDSYSWQDIDAFKSLNSNRFIFDKLSLLYYNRNKKNGFLVSNKINLLDTLNKISSFEELKNKFTGKIVYIDIWATWCLPCRQEFTYYNEIDSFLEKKDIVKLFISIDDLKNVAGWKKATYSYNLSGYHVLANDKLKLSLLKSLQKKGEALLIPRYIIINKKGVIVNKDAPRPSNKEKLLIEFNNII